MSKLTSRTAPRPLTGSSPVKVTDKRVRTHEGAEAYVPKAKGELFKLGISMLAGEDTFYETAEARMQRLAELVEHVAMRDPRWLAGFIPYVRQTMNLRTVSIAMAVEAAIAIRKHPKAALAQGITVRQIVGSAPQRADEVGEFIAYWAEKQGRKLSADKPGKLGGVTLPSGVQRGLSDAVSRLFNEYAAMKYDGLQAPWRLGDVVEMVHPENKGAWQGTLYSYLLDRRHNPQDVRANMELLPMISRNRELRAMPVEKRRAFLKRPEAMTQLRNAGITFEDLSGWVQGALDDSFWEAVIPSMGYMALLRNLRNFDQAGISKDAVRKVCEILEDPEQVARSRQLPFRFWSAYREVPSLHWASSLETALDGSLGNIPTLSGRSLVIVDTSASMQQTMSGKSAVRMVDAAGLFGAALANKNAADLVIFGDRSTQIPKIKGEATLRTMSRVSHAVGSVGHGTEAHAAIIKNFQRGVHDRVFILTDEQAFRSVQRAESAVPADVPVYIFNLNGYRPQMMATGGDTNRHILGGLSDATFQMVPMLEAGEDATWPWEAPQN